MGACTFWSMSRPSFLCFITLLGWPYFDVIVPHSLINKSSYGWIVGCQMSIVISQNNEVILGCCCFLEHNILPQLVEDTLWFWDHIPCPYCTFWEKNYFLLLLYFHYTCNWLWYFFTQYVTISFKSFKWM